MEKLDLGDANCETVDSLKHVKIYAINANKHFPNPNNVEFHEALEKALKSLKTRKWRYNRKQRQAPLHEENEEFPPNRHRRMDSPEEDIIGFEDIQEETEDANEVEETQHMEGAENDEMDTQHTDGTDNNDVDIQNINTVEYADDFEDNMDDQTVEKMAQDKDLQVLLGEQENLMEDDLYGKTGKIILFSSPPDYR